jgi:hypothetical protein
MQCWFFVWAPPRHPKPKRTQTEASKTDASIKTDASGKRVHSQESKVKSHKI